MRTTVPTQSAITTTTTLPPSSTSAWQHLHILDLDDFSREEIKLVFEISDAMKEILAELNVMRHTMIDA